jgi:AraC-like DNA-binding protein
MDTDVTDLRDAYLGTTIMPPAQYHASISLLSIFADQLSLLGNQLVTQQRLAEPPIITRAKKFIEDNYQNDISLGDVAKACNMSLFYFCKRFRRETGVNFNRYVSNVRIDKAKNLLLNPELTISEIAYDVGFQSLTHFNRMFKKLVGESPTEYRGRLPAPAVRSDDQN